MNNDKINALHAVARRKMLSDISHAARILSTSDSMRVNKLFSGFDLALIHSRFCRVLREERSFSYREEVYGKIGNILDNVKEGRYMKKDQLLEALTESYQALASYANQEYFCQGEDLDEGASPTSPSTPE